MISELVYKQAQNTPLAKGRDEAVSLKTPYFFTDALILKLEALSPENEAALRKELKMPERGFDRGLWLSWTEEAAWRLCFTAESLPVLEAHRRIFPGAEAPRPKKAPLPGRSKKAKAQQPS